jgi:hypothetical protein
LRESLETRFEDDWEEMVTIELTVADRLTVPDLTVGSWHTMEESREFN